MTDDTVEHTWEEADRLLSSQYEQPMGLQEYVAAAKQDPLIAADASRYLLDAIESQGTYTVMEEGEEKERYRFFDDPANNGEHAVLGNTDVLNDFVDMLRSKADGTGNDEKIFWFTGPTATGKSEFKNCVINGMREFSKTDDGRRYTLRWNVAGTGDDMTYGGSGSVEDWKESPYRPHPLLAVPREVRYRPNAGDDTGTGLLYEIDEDLAKSSFLRENGLDPLSNKQFHKLLEDQRNGRGGNYFSSITDDSNLQVSNYVMDLGSGIGILTAEQSDDKPIVKMIGKPGQEQHVLNGDIDEMGGVLLQGNGGLTVIEDAIYHIDVVQRLLNVVDDRAVKGHNGETIPIDTEFMIMSNPDFDAQLNQMETQLKQQEQQRKMQQQMQGEDGETEDSEEYADLSMLNADSLRQLRRRLRKFELRYLTNLGTEAELLRREVTKELDLWDTEDYDEVEELMREPLYMRVDSNQEEREVEYAPYAIEAAALYDIVTRLDGSDLPKKLQKLVDDDAPDKYALVKKALLYDQGYLQEGDEILTKDKLGFADDSEDGMMGIPVTYARDILAELKDTDFERHHPELAVEDVILPEDVLDAMEAGLDDPIFTSQERDEYRERVDAVRERVARQQEQDVLTAMMHDIDVSEAAVEQYFDQISAYLDEQPWENNLGEPVEPDDFALEMKVFETTDLGAFTDDDYKKGHAASDDVDEFRRNVRNSHRRLEMNTPPDETIDLSDIPELKAAFAEHDWDGVKARYEDFDPAQWESPADGTETEELKQKTIDYMVDELDYTPASAELTSRSIMERVDA